MLYHSGQPQILFPDAIKEARELPENPSELELQAALGNLLANNIGFAWELLTENSLKEFQEFVLKAWWKKDYNLFVAARGTGKSFLIAIFCILYCIFNPGKKICIVSSNFRRSKAIILQIERFINAKGKNFLRPCFPDIFSSKQNDRYSVKFNNGSEVSGLPLGTGEGLRGERANVLIIDEGLLISRHIRETVLEPFILANLDLTEQTKIKERENELVKAGVMKEEERTKFASNKIIVCSSASFQWEPLYEDIFMDQIKKINEHSGNRNDPSYSVIRCSYHIGMKHGIIEESAIKKVQADSVDAITDPVLGREYWGLFVDGSGGFFPLRTVKECTVKPGDTPTCQLFGRKGSQYILAIDPSFGDGLDSDYFAMGVYLLIPEEKRMVQVLTYGRAGGEVLDHYQYLTYILKSFNIVFCIIDATSTNAQFITQYNESSIALENNTRLGFINVDFEDDEYVKQLHLAKSQWNVEKRTMVYKFVFGSSTIRKTHEFLKSQIDSRKVWFASPITQNKEAFGLYKNFVAPYQLKDTKGKPFDGIIDYIEDCDDWIRRTQDQIALIQVKISAHGSMSFDLPSYCARNEDPDRPRKDNFSALVMGCYAAKFVFDMYDLSMEAPPQSFVPFFI